MHIAAASPLYVSREEVDPAVLEREKEIYRAKAREAANLKISLRKSLKARSTNFMVTFVSLEQPYVKDPDKTIQTYLNEIIATIGENISIRRFAKFTLGEGLAKKENDFAAEVAAAAGV